MIKILFLILAGTAYGVLSSAGVFTVLAAVGLVPRFAGRTHTADKVLLYEEMVIFGTIVGCIFSVFSRYCTPAAWLWYTFRISWSSGGCWAGLFSWFSDFLREPLSGVLRWRLRRCWTVFPYLQEGFLSDMVWAGRF